MQILKQSYSFTMKKYISILALPALFLSATAYAVRVDGECKTEKSGEALTLAVDQSRFWNAIGYLKNGMFVSVQPEDEFNEWIQVSTLETNYGDNFIGSVTSFSIKVNDRKIVPISARFFIMDKKGLDTNKGEYLNCDLKVFLEEI